jgi:regulator of sigma E protease
MEYLLQQGPIAFVIALATLIFFHELGHYLVARACGVSVEVFSIGFGKEIFGWNDSHGTRWKVSLFPLGGYVKMYGDSNAASAPIGLPHDVSPEERAKAFWAKPVTVRSAVVAAGPMANFLLAFILLTGLYVTAGQPYAPPVIQEILPNSAAANANLVVGERIVAINNQQVNSFEEIQRIVRKSPDVALAFTIRGMDDRDRDILITPAVKETIDTFGKVHRTGLLGVKSAAIETRVLSFRQAVVEAAERTWIMTGDILGGLWDIITGVRSFKEVGGPIQIYQVSGHFAAIGIASFVTFLALMSINLGLINLFPIPALDGGHLLFYAAEALRGKPLPERVQEIGSMAGVAMLAMLMGAATWNDIVRLVQG